MDDALNKQLLLELFLSKLKTNSVKTFETIFNEFLDDVIAKAPYIETKSDRREFREFVNSTLTPMYNDLMTNAIEESKAIAIMETSILYEMYGVDKTIEKYMSNINAQTEIHGYKIGDSFKSNRGFYARRLSSIISDGMEQNKTSSEIKKDLKNTHKKQLAHIDTGLVNSIIQKARSLERENTYKVIEKQIDGYYEYCATLDNRTTKRCSSRDGKKFHTNIDKIPSDYKPPIHFRCRSILCFYPNDYKSQNTRASKQYNENGTSTGKQIKNMNYSEWFSTQPKTIQKKYLGKKAFDLYNNVVKFEELFRNNRRFSKDDIFNALK